MNNPFIFETEAENSYSQGEFSNYEDFEAEDFEAENYEAEDFEDYEMADEVRGRVPARPIARPNVRPMSYRPVRSFAPVRRVRRTPYGFRKAYRYRPWAYQNQYRNPYRWRPGYRRYGYGYGGYQPSMAAGYPPDGLASPSQPSGLVMMLQRLLNRTINANLPVDGIMSVETRNALRTFRNQAIEPPPSPVAAPPPAPGASPDGADAPQSEYYELEYLENEFDEFGY